MKVKNALITLCKKMLYESLSCEMMVKTMQMVDFEYDLYKQTGIPENIPITNQIAANQIVLDVIKNDLFIDFIESLIRVSTSGYMGRVYKIKNLEMMIKLIIQEGYIYDRVSGQFYENTNESIQPNWGRLHDGDERQITVLRLDVVGNSILVKRNPSDKVKKTFAELRAIVTKAVVSRSGRLWSWEGDGALAAFILGQKERSAIIAGMDILQELYFYNKMQNTLDAPLEVRISVYGGPVIYSSNTMELLKSETIKEATLLESKGTPKNSMSISVNLLIPVDKVIQDCLGPEVPCNGTHIRHYSVKVAK